MPGAIGGSPARAPARGGPQGGQQQRSLAAQAQKLNAGTIKNQTASRTNRDWHRDEVAADRTTRGLIIQRRPQDERLAHQQQGDQGRRRSGIDAPSDRNG